VLPGVFTMLRMNFFGRLMAVAGPKWSGSETGFGMIIMLGR